MFYLPPVYFIWALIISETQVTCFRFGTIIFAQNVLLKTTSVRFVVFDYMLLVFAPLQFWQILIYCIYVVFHIKIFHTWVFYMQNRCFGLFTHTEFPVLVSWAGNRTRW